MDWLVNLIPGGSLTVAAGAVVAALLALFKAYTSGRTAEKTKQRLKEAEANAKENKRIADAAVSRPVGSVRDDPYNRDNR